MPTAASTAPSNFKRMGTSRNFPGYGGVVPAEFGVQYSRKQTSDDRRATVVDWLASGAARVYICAAATGAKDSSR